MIKYVLGKSLSLEQISATLYIKNLSYRLISVENIFILERCNGRFICKVQLFAVICLKVAPRWQSGDQSWPIKSLDSK